jgi:hypothetical protein
MALYKEHMENIIKKDYIGNIMIKAKKDLNTINKYIVLKNKMLLKCDNIAKIIQYNFKNPKINIKLINMYNKKFKFNNIKFNILLKNIKYNLNQYAIFKKYNYFYNISEHAKKNINTFLNYYYNFNKKAPYINDYYFYNSHMDEHKELLTNINYFNYLFLKLNNLYAMSR